MRSDADFEQDRIPDARRVMLVPEDILSDLHSADNARCSLYGQPLTTSSHAQALVTWRWKMLLIQTSLSSALNEICHELEANQHSASRGDICHGWSGTEQLTPRTSTHLVAEFRIRPSKPL